VYVDSLLLLDVGAIISRSRGMIVDRNRHVLGCGIVSRSRLVNSRLIFGLMSRGMFIRVS